MDIQGKKVMILGQDFDNEHNTAAVIEADGENVFKNRTWINLRGVLEKAQIPLDDCFFTNALMGVRQGSRKSSGRSPGFESPAFLETCRRFFLEQVRKQQPRLILVLGWYPVVFLRDLQVSATLYQNWNAVNTITELVKDPTLVSLKNVPFYQTPGINPHVLAMFHPSLRNVNVLKLTRQDFNFFIDTEIQRIKSLYAII
jgi:uracil-DNA glycosylase